MKKKSLMFQFVNDKDDTNQMNYIKQKYEFLERLYWSFVYQFLACVHTLYWEKITHSDLVVLSKFISGGEDVLNNKNPNNTIELVEEFFGNERRSNLQLSECVKLAIEMNKPYLLEIRKYAELQYPSQLDITKVIPEVNKKKKNKKNKNIL